MDISLSNPQTDENSDITPISVPIIIEGVDPVIFSPPIDLVPIPVDVVNHETTMTAGRLHAERQLAAALTPQVVHDLVRLRPSEVSAGEVRTAVKKAKDELKHGHSLNKVFQTLRNAFEVFLMPIVARPDADVSTKHAHEAAKDLAKLLTPAVVKDLVQSAPKGVNHMEMRTSVHELKTDLRSGQGIVPWLNSAADMGGHHIVNPFPVIHPM
jgi:hypothetical protein